MKILDGKKLSEKIADDLKSQIFDFSQKNPDAPKPKLVIIQIGDNKASSVYIKMKQNFAKKIGVTVEVSKFDQNISETELLAHISECNTNSEVHGIIVQLPIPESLNIEKILNSIAPEKDVDGLGQFNLAKLVRESGDGIVPATARGIVDLLKAYDVEIEGREIAVVGRSVLVGKSTALYCLNNNASVSVYHKKTKKLHEQTRKADILISATGVSGLITLGHVNPDQIIVDVGISVDNNGNISGDVSKEVKDNGSVQAISPVPGGVGPMTVASLFQNLVESSQR
jgi:methylenetetrahydrofolate dehydrogenase (NADP+)/methenyltetrahydrofolate cyclohydrolase